MTSSFCIYLTIYLKIKLLQYIYKLYYFSLFSRSLLKALLYAFTSSQNVEELLSVDLISVKEVFVKELSQFFFIFEYSFMKSSISIIIIRLFLIYPSFLYTRIFFHLHHLNILLLHLYYMDFLLIQPLKQCTCSQVYIFYKVQY